MSQPTTYKRSFAGSVGAGVKSVMGGNDRRYYILEHKISSKYHKAGESQRIIVDQIELGRDAKCQVRFDESFGTVSRRHAAIEKDGDNWKLVQLSSTNSTYLNGKKVEKEWYLQSGDEIQLSTNGPKLGFIVPQGDKSLVKSIGMTARLNLFRQQALRPYKQAIAALTCVLVLCMCGGGYTLYENVQEYKRLEQAFRDAIRDWDATQRELNDIIADLQKANSDLLTNAKKRDAEISRLKKHVNDIKVSTQRSVVANINNDAINSCLPSVFFIQTVGFDITFPDGTSKALNCDGGDIPGWTGTGFLLSNGKFVTARHVAEAWYFWRDGSGTNEQLLNFNLIANNGGKIVAHFVAVSSSGRQLKFTSDQFRCNRSHDGVGNTDDGNKISLARLDETDFAYLEMNDSGRGLLFDSSKSCNLDRGTKLTVLGFPLGLGATSTSVNPIYGSVIVASQGLYQGRIVTTDTNYEHGNSGGPVFYEDSGKLVVVGIVSAGAGRTTGFIVPISVIQ